MIPTPVSPLHLLLLPSHGRRVAYIVFKDERLPFKKEVTSPTYFIGAHAAKPWRNLKSIKYSEPSPFKESPTGSPKMVDHQRSDLFKGAEQSTALPPD